MKSQLGIEAEESVQLPLRDDRQVDKQARKRDELVAEGAQLRELHADEDYTEQGDDSSSTDSIDGDAGDDVSPSGGATSAR